nr:MAG TPA: hypothetical protein [Caudoviricetes sp.]
MYLTSLNARARDIKERTRTHPRTRESPHGGNGGRLDVR